MVRDEEAVAAALEAAEDGLLHGEMPVGAAVFVGSTRIAAAYTQERALRRRIVHADLLALLQADEQLRFTRRTEPLTLAVSLEPCLMCLGAAITLGVERVLFALESPNDGAVDLLGRWQPPVEQPFFRRPDRIRGGILRRQSQELFARYASGQGPQGMRDWAESLAGLPEA